MIILLIILLFCSSIISALETAITSISLAKLKKLINKKKKSNKFLQKCIYILNNYNRSLMSILILNTLINSAIAALCTILLNNNLNNISNGYLAIISTLLSTISILFIGEIPPKILAKKYSERYFISTAYLLYFILVIFYPLLWWTKYISESKNKDHINEDELLELINIVSDNGILELEEKKLVSSALEFDDKKIRQIMIPKGNVKFLYHDVLPKDIVNFYKKYNYSRVPIVHHISKRVSGIIHIKDFIKDIINDKEPSINNLIKQPLFMYGNTDLDNALKMMQEKQNHIAIIISSNKENNFLGIVTLEDLIEQIIGKVYDEYDKPGKIKEIGHSKWVVSADTNCYFLFTNYLNLKTSIKNKDLKLIQWFILKKKLPKKFAKWENKKLTYKNYIFKPKIIINQKNPLKKEIFFEITSINCKL